MPFRTLKSKSKLRTQNLWPTRGIKTYTKKKEKPFKQKKILNRKTKAKRGHILNKNIFEKIKHFLKNITTKISF